MNGFESEVRTRFIGVSAHVQISTTHDQGIADATDLNKQLLTLPHVQAAAPYIDNKALIMSKEASTGLLIRGIEAESAVKVNDIGKNINFGRLELGLIEQEGERPLPGIVLGYNLADRMMVTLGDVVTIASLTGIRHVSQIPHMMQFRVAGYFETGLYEFDDNLAYISIESAQKLFQMGAKVTGIELRLDQYQNAHSVAKGISARFAAPYRTQTWFDKNQNLFAWMEIEKWAAFLVLSLIIMVAAFNIASTLIMVTMEKTKEIGILKSMGATTGSIRRIFTFEGLVVGAIGTILGCAIGYTVCWAQVTYKFFALPSDIYIINWLPVIMKWSDFALISLAAIGISFIASVYPAQKAAKLDSVTAIRYE